MDQPSFWSGKMLILLKIEIDVDHFELFSSTNSGYFTYLPNNLYGVPLTVQFFSIFDFLSPDWIYVIAAGVASKNTTRLSFSMNQGYQSVKLTSYLKLDRDQHICIFITAQKKWFHILSGHLFSWLNFMRIYFFLQQICVFSLFYSLCHKNLLYGFSLSLYSRR